MSKDFLGLWQEKKRTGEANIIEHKRWEKLILIGHLCMSHYAKYAASHNSHLVIGHLFWAKHCLCFLSFNLSNILSMLVK